MKTIDLDELQKEKEALHKVVKAAVETFIERTGLVPEISIFKEIIERKMRCTTTISESDLTITIRVNI